MLASRTRSLARHSLGPCLALAVFASLARAQAVVVVDQAMGAGANFDNLSQAVQAVDEGGLILVRGGEYQPFVVSAKSVSIVAEEGQAPVVRGSIRVDLLQANQMVAMRGFTVVAPDFAYAATFERNRGPIHVEDCSFAAASGDFSSGGLFVTQSASLTLVRVDVTAASRSGVERDAVTVVDSDVYLYGGSYVGSDAPVGYQTSFAGSSAVVASNSRVWVIGAELLGGQGGSAFAFGPCVDGGDGGAGLVIEGTEPRGVMLDADIRGGAPGPGGTGCLDGMPGESIRVLSGNFFRRPGEWRDFTTSGVVREGEPLTETFSGAEGELVWVVRSGTLNIGRELPDIRATYHLGPMYDLHFNGVLPEAGVLAATHTLSMIDLPSVRLVEQAVYVDPTTMTAVFSSPVVLLLVDSAH